MNQQTHNEEGARFNDYSKSLEEEESRQDDLEEFKAETLARHTEIAKNFKRMLTAATGE